MSAGGRTGRILCPKCRSLGLTTDCTDRIIHAQKESRVSVGAGDEEGESFLDVTLNFTVPISSSLPLDPHEMASHMREEWMSDDRQFQEVLAEVVDGEYDLSVQPAFYDL